MAQALRKYKCWIGTWIGSTKNLMWTCLTCMLNDRFKYIILLKKSIKFNICHDINIMIGYFVFTRILISSILIDSYSKYS